VIAHGAYQKLIKIVWAAVLISLPITSFPILEKRIGAVVSPLAAAPLIILIILWFIPYIWRGGQLPKECLPILVFCLAALFASALSYFIEVPSLKNASIPGQEARVIITLALGISFYLVFSSFPKDQESINFTLKWINIGGAVLILWTLTQVYFMFFNSAKYPHWYVDLQSIFSSKTAGLKWVVPRLTGLAYESSWFSHQLMVLYFPLWFAASIQRVSAFKQRILHLSIENILLAIGIIEFFLTSPRISLIALFVVGIYLFGKINIRLHRKMMKWLGEHWQTAWQKHRLTQTGLAFAIGLVIVIFYISLTGLIVFICSQRDWRIALLFKTSFTPDDLIGLLTFNESTYIRIGYQLAFGERIIYWLTGFRIFNTYPWFGVGLGNSGFYFLEKMPVLGFASPEIRSLLNISEGLPNIKSLWFRLLAETGLVGFSLFISWLVGLWRSTRMSGYSDQTGIKVISLAGQLSLLAFIAEGFSIDSFAMPYLWVMAGLISAVGMSFRRQLKKSD
jgi:hypothetical protein